MCGIAGLSMSPNDLKLNARQVAVGLLNGIASRGPDATGAAWYNPEDDTVSLTKVAVPAWRFIEARAEVIPEATPTMLLHTRFSTHGDSSVRANNHPIVHGNIIGIHNGVLSNHKSLFGKVGREPLTEVDSEAMFAMIDAQDGRQHPAEFLGDIRGDAAIAWINLTEPEVLHLANITGRPMHIAQTEGGSLFFASTMDAIDSMAEDCELPLVYRAEVPDEKYMRVVDGVIADYLEIENVVSTSYQFRQSYAYTSGAGSSGGSKGSGATKTETKAITKGSEDEPTTSAASDKTAKEVEGLMKGASNEKLKKWSENGSAMATAELHRRMALPEFLEPKKEDVKA